MRTRFFYSILLCLAVATVANGQARKIHAIDSLLILPELTITSPRFTASTESAPNRIFTIPAASIEASSSRTVSEVLDRSSTAFIRQYGGGLATLSLRGTSPSQTLVLIDGHRFSDPQLGQVDLSLLPGRFVESADVSYGAGSSLFGSAAVGGVINLNTLTHVAARPFLSVGSATGRFGERGGYATISAGGTKQGLLVSGQFDQAENDFPYWNTALFPPSEVLRQGADRRQISGLATYRRRGETSLIKAGGLVADAERGLPGPAGRKAAGERQWDTHARLWGSIQRSAGGGQLRVATALQHTSLRYLNPLVELDETGTTTAVAADAEWTSLINSRFILNPGLSMSFGTANHPNLVRPHEWTGAGYLGGTWAAGIATISPSVRTDVIRTGGDSWTIAPSGRLGANIPLLTDLLHVKSSVGTSFRAPTLNDRFWVPGGNPDLDPERSTTLDGGLLLAPGSVTLEVSGFFTVTRDQIVWTPEGTVWTPKNRDRVRNRGVEATLAGQPIDTRRSSIRTGISYVLVDARDRSDPLSDTFNKPLRYVPRHQAKGHVDLEWSRLRGALFARWVSTRYVTVDASQGVDPYFVLDGRIAMLVRVASVNTEIALSFENILDAGYEVIRGYPMPPRRVTVQLDVSID